jgi:hypothetical protein
MGTSEKQGAESADRELRLTVADYELVAEAVRREEQRLELFRQVHGQGAADDQQIERLIDLARRIHALLGNPDRHVAYIQCPGCGGELEATATICRACNRCPNCGQRRSSGNAACRCGHPSDPEKLGELVRRFGVAE